MKWSLMLVLPLMAAATVVWKVAAVDPPNYTVLLPNPEDCGSYYSCSNGVPILMPCPEGLHFNATLSVCDYPQNAECADPDLLYGYYLSCVDGGVETGVFDNSGKATISGVGIEGSIGAVYEVKWERWQCVEAKNNPTSTCKKSAQGVRVERL
jgi:hypothetical protein